MKEPSIKKLTPYFFRLTDKSRLIVYLLATGQYNYDMIRKIKVSELSKLKKQLPDMFDDVIYDLTFNRDEGAIVFHISDKMYSRKQLSNILERAHKIADVPYTNLENFVKSVSIRKKAEEPV